MRKITLLKVVFLLPVFLFVLHSKVSGQASEPTLIPNKDYVQSEVIVKYKSGLDPVSLEQAARVRSGRGSSFFGILQNASQNLGLALKGELTPEKTLGQLQEIADAVEVDSSIELSPEQNLYLYRAKTDEPITEVALRYQTSAAVEYSEPNYLFQPLAVPNDTEYGKLWGMDRIKASAAWDRSTGQSTVKVAVVDTGVDASHPDLATNVVETKAFADRCASGRDLGGHGTHVAGTIGAVGNNNTGVAGVNWKVSILGYCVNGAGGLPLSAVASAIDAAVAAGAKVINLSLGGEANPVTMQNSIAAAVRAGTTIVASAGNSPGANADILYPARDPNVITVSATGPSDELAHYSSYGRSVDVSAPGGNPTSGSSSCTAQNCIYSTMPSGRYGYLAGTSMSAPHVTGLAALMLSVNPNLSPQQIQSIMQSTADDLGTSGRDDKFGHGRINAQAALERAVLESGATAGPSQPPSTGTGTPAPTSAVKPSKSPPVITLPPHQCPDLARTGDFNCDKKVDNTDFEKWGQDFRGGNSVLSFFELIRRGLSGGRPGSVNASPTP